MNDRDARLLSALKTVPADGTLEPSWESLARPGFVYRGTGSALQDERLGEDLEYLADRDYLERVFVERVSLCGSCGSHAVNVHEACMSCASSNLVQFKALLHFRCGYVGPVSAFREERQGLRCPKCNRILADVGTDHDSPGEYFRCKSCASMFQVPDVGARCLSCGARFTGTAMHDVGHRDVFAYRLTNLGRAALSENRLLEDAGADAASEGVERRHLLLQEVEEARRARIENGQKFGLLVIRCGVNGTVLPQADVAAAIGRTVSQTYSLGRLDAQHLVMLVPNASASTVKSLSGQLGSLANTVPLKTRVVEIADSEPVNDALEFAARQLDG